MSVFQLELGTWAEDGITSFQGTIIGRAQYFTGCVQYCVAPMAKDNEHKDSQWFDEGRLLLGAKTVVESKAQPPAAAPGGPQSSTAPSK